MHQLRPHHLDVQARDRQATLVVHPLAVGLDDLRVDDGQRFVAEVPDDDLLLHADLRRGERETVAGVLERVEHVVDQPDDLAVDVVDRAGLGFQDRVTEGADVVRHPDRLRAVTADGDDRSRRRPAGPAQYFDDDPDVASDPVTIDVTLPDTAFTLRTDRGVFARGQLDTGTSMLLRIARCAARVERATCSTSAAARVRSRMTMARRSPDATVWAVDVNRRALELCRANAAANGLTNITACLPDEVPPAIRFDSIWSNPPIRIGKARPARAPAALAAAAGRRRHVHTRRPEAPRGRLAAALARPNRATRHTGSRRRRATACSACPQPAD